MTADNIMPVETISLASLSHRHWTARPPPYLYLLPAVLMVGGFLLYPAVYTLYISLTSWNGLETPKFIGLQNYVQFLQDPVFQTSLTNTVIWVIGTILFPVLLWLGMSLLITRMRF